MSKFVSSEPQQKRKRRSPLILLLLILLWSIGLGWGMALAFEPPSNFAQSDSSQNWTAQNVDPVPERYKLGQELYLENCGSCHIAIPPQVLPTQTWRQILQQPNEHYGTNLPEIIGPSLLLMWEYIRTYSRPLAENEAIPYRIADSRYFKALHPKVDLPQQITVNTCATCHNRASEFDYRSLTEEWENSP